MKILADGAFASFEGMCWTIPSQRLANIAHKVTWGTPSKEEMQILASLVSCYATLIEMPEKMRRVRIRQLRKALKLAATSARGEHE